MPSTRDQVREVLDRLTDDEANEILLLLRQIEQRRRNRASMPQLAGDPSIRIPHPEVSGFRPVTPILALGRRASAILIEDRR